MTGGVRFWLRVAAAVAILGFLGWQLGTDAFRAGLTAVSTGTVLAALGCGLLWTACNAARWRLIAHQLGVDLPWSAALADTYRAQFVNAVLPTGVLGDVHRAWSHGRQVGDLARGTRIVVLERLSGQLVLAGAATLALALQPTVLMAAAREIGAVPAAGLAAVAVVALGLVLAVRLRPDSRLRTALTYLWAEVRTGVLAVWLGVVALSIGALCGYAALFLVAARSIGATAPLGVLLPLLLVALVAMALPVNVGGWGPREATAAGMFALVGLGAADGLSAAVAYGVLTTVALLPGAAVVLLRHRIRAASSAHRSAPAGVR